MKFTEKLALACRGNRSLLCVGLDPDPAQMPGAGVLEFNKAIIDATKDLVCAYKPNFAFYEALGKQGITILEETIAAIPRNVPIIGDAKRGDIGNTAKAYAKSLFEVFNVDAATVSPYLGGDSIEPFLEYADKGIFLLCRTSNPGAADLQDLRLESGRTLYEEVALKARAWNTRGNIGLVAGATHPEELGRIRALCPDMPLLVPGVGAQGGELKKVLRFGLDADRTRTIINVSRQVLYAWKGSGNGADFAAAARRAAEGLRDQINGAAGPA